MLGILIHGDAAFPGQGVVAETLNLSRLDGYEVGGIIHIIANNQLGFTATPKESYSTSYASGLARGFKIPIVHVNADDPVACIEAARLAWAYRHRFRLDSLIDLVGYRRYGHNEGDEPAFTQPEIYQIVAGHPTVRELYARQLAEAGRSSPDQADAMVKMHMAALEQAYAALKPEQDYVPPLPEVPPSGAARRAQTTRAARSAVRAQSRAAEGARGIFGPPQARTRARTSARRCSTSRRAIGRLGHGRRARVRDRFSRTASPIRLTGEDVERGTFSQRHAVLHDSVTGDEHIPLRRCRRAAPRSKFTTARCPRTRPSASSSATTSRSRAGSWCGKRSTATSSTARRSSSMSSSRPGAPSGG